MQRSSTDETQGFMFGLITAICVVVGLLISAARMLLYSAAYPIARVVKRSRK